MKKERKARQILQALIDGVDPSTGEELPPGTVLQEADVLRALLAGAAALDQVAAREQRRAQLPGNVGSTWTKEEEAELVAAFNAREWSRESLEDIAARHRRTPRAIEARLERLGLITQAQRTSGPGFPDPTARGAGGSQTS